MIGNNRLIIGVGNELRGDDAFGLKVVQGLKSDYPELSDYYMEQQDLTRCIGLWQDKNVVIIDALCTEKPEVGRIHLASSMDQLCLKVEANYTTHGFGLAAIFELSTALNCLPRSSLIIGVEGTNWEVGSPLSSALEQSIPEVMTLVINYFSK